MAAKTSKRYSSLKSLLSPFNLFLNFLLSGPHKTTATVLNFGNFEFLIFQDFFFTFRKNRTLWEPNFKTLLLPEITSESFQPFPEISSQRSSQKCCFGFFEF